MKQAERPRGYRGGYLIGFILIAVVTFRLLLFYGGQASLLHVLALIAIYTLFYASEPWLSKHFPVYTWIYLLIQTLIVVGLSSQRPFLDFQNLLYFPLWIQVFRTFSLRVAIGWLVFFIILLALVLIPGIGLLEGFAFILLMLASGTFLISYDFLYCRTLADQTESERLLANLQSAHLELQEQAAQADDLAAARERNRLARELHDSVSQMIFSITLTSQSARLLLERDPARVPAEIERLQEMTSGALRQLRSLIAELRPH